MKTRFLFVFTLVLALATVPAAQAGGSGDAGVDTVADIALVRPLCFGATVLGSAFFVVGLPIAALTGSVRRSANALVVRPARATFVRPLGDMDALKN